MALGSAKLGSSKPNDGNKKKHVLGSQKESRSDKPVLGSSKRERQDWEKHESEIIEEQWGGKRQPGSGAVAHKKSDGMDESRRLRIECKSTGAKAFVLDQSTLAKIESESRPELQIPILALRFTEPIIGMSPDWAALPMAKFEEIFRYAAERGYKG